MNKICKLEQANLENKWLQKLFILRNKIWMPHLTKMNLGVALLNQTQNPFRQREMKKMTLVIHLQRRLLPFKKKKDQKEEPVNNLRKDLLILVKMASMSSNKATYWAKKELKNKCPKISKRLPITINIMLKII